MSAAPALQPVRRQARRSTRTTGETPRLGTDLAGPKLRVVSAPKRRLGAMVYTALCLVLLVGGSAAVLWLNTSLAAGAFEIHELEAELANYKTQEEVIAEQLTALSEPGKLAAAAEELGMVESHAVGYIVLKDSTVIGSAPAAEAEKSEEEPTGTEGANTEGGETGTTGGEGAGTTGEGQGVTP